MLASFITLLISNRRAAIFLFAVFVIAGISGVLHLQIELSGREFIAHRNDDIERLAAYVDEWGDDSNVLIAIADGGEEGVLTEGRMLAMARLARSIRDVEGIEGAWSLQDFPRFQKSPDGRAKLAVVLGTAPSDAALLSDWQNSQLNDPLLVPGMLSVDGRYAVLLIQMDTQLEGINALQKPVAAVKAIVSEFQGVEELRLTVTGLPAIRVALLEVVAENQFVLVPLSMLLVISLLALFYRRTYAVLLPVIAGVLSVSILLGIMGWTGEPIGLLNQFYFTIIPVIVMVDGVHVVERYAGEMQQNMGRLEAIKTVASIYANVGTACFLTSITTAIGFMSLALGNIEALHQFGIYAALGIIIGFALVVTILPLILVEVRDPRIRHSPFADALLRSLANVAVKIPGRICALSIVFFLLLAVLATRVESGSTMTGDLPVAASASVGGRLLDGHLSGQFVFAITLEGDNLATHAVLGKINRLESRWRESWAIRTVLGPGTAVRHANRWADDSGGVPVADEGIDDFYQSLLRFTELPTVLSADNQRARILITAPDLGTSQMLRHGRELVADAREILRDDSISVDITGAQWNLYLGYAEIGADLRKSILFAFAAIMLIMAVLFRSTVIPLLMLLPNLLPLLAGYAMLAVVGWKLSIVPAVVLALAVGIVVDDSIHMMVRMREELRRGRDATVAVRYAILHSGRAIMTSTLVLVAGFAVNGFSRFPINQTFALIGSVVLIAALVCDLVLLPALLILWQRRAHQ